MPVLNCVTLIDLVIFGMYMKKHLVWLYLILKFLLTGDLSNKEKIRGQWKLLTRETPRNRYNTKTCHEMPSGNLWDVSGAGKSPLKVVFQAIQIWHQRLSRRPESCDVEEGDFLGCFHWAHWASPKIQRSLSLKQELATASSLKLLFTLKLYFTLGLRLFNHPSLWCKANKSTKLLLWVSWDVMTMSQKEFQRTRPATFRNHFSTIHPPFKQQHPWVWEDMFISSWQQFVFHSIH